MTILGPSSGAQSVAIHLTSKKSDAMFSQGILLDTPFSTPFHEINSETPISVGSIFAKYLNCSSEDKKCMRRRSEEDVVAAQVKTETEIYSNLTLENFLYGAEIWNPVVDGIEVEGNPLEIIKQPGRSMTKPLIVGSNKDDCRLILAAFGDKPLSMEYYLQAMLLIFKADAAKVVAKYPPTPRGDNGDQFAAVLTDYLVTCSNRLFARNARNGQAVYNYIYSFPTQTEVYPNTKPVCVNYSCHASDTIQAFGTFALTGISPSEEVQRSSDSMLYYWLNFAHTGDPSNNTWSNITHECSTECYTQWPRYDSSTDWQNMNFGFLSNDIISDYREDFCDLWDSIGYIKESKNIKSTKAKCQVRDKPIS